MAAEEMLKNKVNRVLWLNRIYAYKDKGNDSSIYRKEIDTSKAEVYDKSLVATGPIKW